MKGLLVGFFLVAFTNFILLSESLADDGARRVLFNDRALVRANRVVHPAPTPRKKSTESGRLVPTSSSFSSLDDELRLDSVDDFILRAEKDGNIFTSPRSMLYLRYLNDWATAENLDEYELKSFAERVLLFQCSEMITQFLATSPLQDLYQRMVRAVKRYRDYTTVQVGTTRRGKLQVVQSENFGKGKRLLEFKLHSSLNNGIEPRLKVWDNLMFRYDVIEQNALVEYRIDF